MVGSRRFLERVWKLQNSVIASEAKQSRNGSPRDYPRDDEKKSFEILLNKTIKKVTDDILNFNFNTVISALMILINTAEKVELSQNDYEIILKLLAPFAPHITEEIWANLGHKKSIHIEKWPEFDPQKIVSSDIIIIVQINGKPRATFPMPVGSIQAEVEKVAFGLADVSKWLVGKEIKKRMFIKERILSVITD